MDEFVSDSGIKRTASPLTPALSPLGERGRDGRQALFEPTRRDPCRFPSDPNLLPARNWTRPLWSALVAIPSPLNGERARVRGGNAFNDSTI